MTNEQAIKFANCLKNNYTIDFNDMADFCDTVTKALEQQENKGTVLFPKGHTEFIENKKWEDIVQTLKKRGDENG